MKTTLAVLLFSSSAALAGNAPIAPDFVGAAPPLHIDRSLTASSDAMNRIEPLDVVAFGHDSTRLEGGSLDQVDRAATWLLQHRGHRIVLEGHTDASGMFPYNADLATRRMEAVRNRLLAWGVPSDRIVLITYGETRATPTDNPADRRVVMFATTRPVRDVVATQLEHRQALVAAWTERGTMLTLQNGLGRPLSTSKTAVSRR